MTRLGTILPSAEPEPPNMMGEHAIGGAIFQMDTDVVDGSDVLPAGTKALAQYFPIHPNEVDKNHLTPTQAVYGVESQMRFVSFSTPDGLLIKAHSSAQ